jgi:hypothetical protein
MLSFGWVKKTSIACKTRFQWLVSSSWQPGSSVQSEGSESIPWSSDLSRHLGGFWAWTLRMLERQAPAGVSGTLRSNVLDWSQHYTETLAYFQGKMDRLWRIAVSLNWKHQPTESTPLLLESGSQPCFQLWHRWWMHNGIMMDPCSHHMATMWLCSWGLFEAQIQELQQLRAVSTCRCSGSRVAIE